MGIPWPAIVAALALGLYVVFNTTPEPENFDADATPVEDDPGNDPTMPIFDTVPASPVVRDLASAIARAEGFGVAGAIPTKAHNPGDLVLPGWKGPTLGSQNISVFASDAEGWVHLWHQVQAMASGTSRVYRPSMTLAEVARKWTGTQVNDWTNNVVAYLNAHGYPGTTADTVLADLFAAN